MKVSCACEVFSFYQIPDRSNCHKIPRLNQNVSDAQCVSKDKISDFLNNQPETVPQFHHPISVFIEYEIKNYAKSFEKIK